MINSHKIQPDTLLFYSRENARVWTAFAVKHTRDANRVDGFAKAHLLRLAENARAKSREWMNLVKDMLA